MHKDILNIAELRENIGEDCAAEPELLQIFVESCEEGLNALEALLEHSPCEDSIQQWQHYLHQIKGAAMNVYAPKLLKVVQEVHEARMMHNDALRKVQQEFTHVKEEIAELKMQ